MDVCQVFIRLTYICMQQFFRWTFCLEKRMWKMRPLIPHLQLLAGQAVISGAHVEALLEGFGKYKRIPIPGIPRDLLDRPVGSL